MMNVVKLFSVDICFLLPCLVYGAEIVVHTPDSKDYIIVHNITNSIRDRYIDFKVKTCEHAYIGLISGNTDSDPLYEIVIGGFIKGLIFVSYIRIGRDYNAPIVYGNMYSFLQCYSYTNFVIIWNNTTINVLIRHDETSSWYLFLVLTVSSNLLPISNVGICTMYGSTGQWHFYTPELPTSFGETTALLESTTADVTGRPQITTDNYMSTITERKSTRPLTYTSTDTQTMNDETTELPQTTRPDNMTTTSEDLPSRITNDDTVVSDTSSASTSTKSSTMTLKFMTTLSTMSISNPEPCAGTCTSTCTCNCLDVPKKASNKVLGNQLKIDKKILSSYKRRLQSATDPRKSSLYIGCVGIVVFSVIVAFIVLLDFLPSA